MKKIKALVYSQAKQAIPILAKLFGANLLDKQATLAKLKSYQIFIKNGEEIIIPPAGVTSNEAPENFNNNEPVITSTVAVYNIHGTNKVTIFPYGGVKLNRDVLDMDFGSALFIKTLLKVDKRLPLKCDVCIVLWSHEWGNGYYDYTYFIFAKLLRIKAVMGEADFKQARIVYPLVNTAFEKELMAYTGVNAEQLVDSRKYNLTADSYYLANNDSWYFHNKHDLLVLKDTLASIETSAVTGERIYIQRKGRRKLTNEIDVINLLKKYDFTIIEDTARTVAEQIAIYHTAKVIIGPHGASYTNIINCKPGTILIELFPNNYYPDYFRYLASIDELKYFAIFQQNIQESRYSNLDEDMTIDPAKIKNLLDQILP